MSVQDLWRYCIDLCSISAGRDLKQQHNGRLWNIICLEHILNWQNSWLLITNLVGFLITNGHCATNQCRRHATNHITLHRWHIKLAYYQPSQTEDFPIYCVGVCVYTHTHNIFSLSLVWIHLNAKMDGLKDVLIFKPWTKLCKIKQVRLHYCLSICSVYKHVFCQSECVLCIALLD